jgi:hypothetical protein
MISNDSVKFEVDTPTMFLWRLRSVDKVPDPPRASGEFTISDIPDRTSVWREAIMEEDELSVRDQAHISGAERGQKACRFETKRRLAARGIRFVLLRQVSILSGFALMRSEEPTVF